MSRDPLLCGWGRDAGRKMGSRGELRRKRRKRKLGRCTYGVGLADSEGARSAVLAVRLRRMQTRCGALVDEIRIQYELNPSFGRVGLSNQDSYYIASYYEPSDDSGDRNRGKKHETKEGIENVILGRGYDMEAFCYSIRL